MKVFLLLTLLVMHSCVGLAQSYEGSWKGDLKIGSTTIPFILNLKQVAGKWSVTADSPNQGAVGIPGEVDIHADSLFIRLKGGIVLNGVINAKDSIQATFFQNGMQLPLLLVRQQSAVTGLKRTQLVKPPYTYDTLDVKFHNTYDNIELAGTLTYPRQTGRYPAVVLVTGSGPQNRNEEFFGHEPFKVLADYLTKNGIVVLRYDDRGVGQSAGVFESSTIENFSKDAMAALEFLKKQKQVDASRIGFIGHSEGGLIAKLLASQQLTDLSFVVSLAGPAIPIDQLMVEQLYAIGRSEGMSAVDLEVARQINTKNFAVIKGELDSKDAYTQLLQNMGITTQKAQDAVLRKELMTMLAPPYRYFLRINPANFIAKITIPVFAAYGALDVQVPATINLKALHDLLPVNSRSILKEYTELNHLFQTAKTGRIAEYGQLEETMSPQLMNDVATWINGL